MFINMMIDYEFNDLICPFGLSIYLKVVSCGYKKLRSKNFPKAFLKTENKFKISI